MKQDVKDTIDHSVPCLRHCAKPVQENTARAIPIANLFDRVGMDCIFGLAETEEGYTGIQVLTE